MGTSAVAVVSCRSSLMAGGNGWIELLPVVWGEENAWVWKHRRDTPLACVFIFKHDSGNMGYPEASFLYIETHRHSYALCIINRGTKTLIPSMILEPFPQGCKYSLPRVCLRNVFDMIETCHLSCLVYFPMTKEHTSTSRPKHRVHGTGESQISRWFSHFHLHV